MAAVYMEITRSRTDSGCTEGTLRTERGSRWGLVQPKYFGAVSIFSRQL